MGLFKFFKSSTPAKKTIDDFGTDCGKKSIELATKHGLILGKHIAGDQDLIYYCEQFNENMYECLPSDYFGYSDICEALAVYAVEIGIVLGGFKSTVGLEQIVFDNISNSGPNVAGEMYLRIVGLEDEGHPFFDDLIDSFRQLYNEYKLSPSDKEYLLRGMTMLSVTGLTIYYDKGIKY